MVIRSLDWQKGRESVDLWVSAIPVLIISCRSKSTYNSITAATTIYIYLCISNCILNLMPSIIFFSVYAFMSEHLDLRHIMGAGIAITRGSAASLSFCYSLLLLTMCRNLITKMKEHSLHQYIPLDSHLQFHKIVACTALFFSIMHAAGHLVNFYHVGTQPIDHLHCMTKEMRFATDQRPGIDFWFFQVKFMFSKKATKIEKVFTVDLTLI